MYCRRCYIGDFVSHKAVKNALSSMPSEIHCAVQDLVGHFQKDDHRHSLIMTHNIKEGKGAVSKSAEKKFSFFMSNKVRQNSS